MHVPSGSLVDNLAVICYQLSTGLSNVHVCGLEIGSTVHIHYFITSHACTRGKAIGFICHVCHHWHENRHILRSRHLSDTMNPLKLAKNWLQYASFPLAWPTSVTNSAFLLAMPIDHAYCRSCFLLMCTTGLAYVGKGRQQPHNTWINAAPAALR